MKSKIAKILTRIHLVWLLLIPLLYAGIKMEFFGIAQLQYSDALHTFVVSSVWFALVVPITSIAVVVMTWKERSLFTIAVNLAALALAVYIIVAAYFSIQVAMGV